MNTEKLTQKSMEAIRSANSLAVEYGNQQIDQAHLFLALLSQQDGLIPQIIPQMGTDLQMLQTEAQRLVDQRQRAGQGICNTGYGQGAERSGKGCPADAG